MEKAATFLTGKFLVAVVILDSDFSPTEITVVTLNYALFVITKCCQG